MAAMMADASPGGCLRQPDRHAIFFGSTKMNNNFSLVDDVVKQAGGTATIFVKNGDEFVRVATNIKKDDGSRAIGTILDPKGKAIASIQKNESFYGDVDIPRQTLRDWLRTNTGFIERDYRDILCWLFEVGGLNFNIRTPANPPPAQP
jgi:Cache 3/Cache 2 fusion domain